VAKALLFLMPAWYAPTNCSSSTIATFRTLFETFRLKDAQKFMRDDLGSVLFERFTQSDSYRELLGRFSEEKKNAWQELSLALY